MGSHYQLHLEHIPWPISVLKFNNAVNAMRTGDDMIVTMRDPDVVENIRQLLSSRPDLHYEAQQNDAEYSIHVVKGKPGRWGKRL